MKSMKLIAIALGSALAMPALADSPAVTSNVSLTTNYLYRGISQTAGGPAIQGGFDYAHPSGLYVGVWGSSITWVGQGFGATGAGTELDTYFGYRGGSDLTYDVGFLRYNYLGSYPIITAPFANPNTNEIYGKVGYSIVSLKLSYSLGDLFGVKDANGSTYIDLSASYPIPNTKFTVGAHYGKQTYKGTGADTLKAANLDPTYSDYNVSGSMDLGSGFSTTLMYSKTNARVGGYYTVGTGNGGTLNTGKGIAVLSLNRTF